MVAAIGVRSVPLDYDTRVTTTWLDDTVWFVSMEQGVENLWSAGSKVS